MKDEKKIVSWYNKQGWSTGHIEICRSKREIDSALFDARNYIKLDKSNKFYQFRNFMFFMLIDII